MTGIGTAIAAIRVLGPASFAWLGAPQATMAAAAVARLSPQDRRVYLHGQLQRCLYTCYYRTGIPLPPSRARHRAAVPHDDFGRELAAANQGSGCWEPGWERAGDWRDGKATVRRRSDGLTAVADTAEWRADDTAERQPTEMAGQPGPSPGEPGAVRLPPGLFRISPGFYMALGDRAPQASAELVRVYWNAAPAGALALMDQVTSALNKLRVPFRMKAADSRAGYHRADAVVAYLDALSWRAWLTPVTQISERVAPHLSAAVPAMTLRVADGVAVAEDPGHGRSFGLSRCGLIAEGVVQAWESGDTADTGATMKHVTAVFEEADVDLAAPYRRRAADQDAGEPMPSLWTALGAAQ